MTTKLYKLYQVMVNPITPIEVTGIQNQNQDSGNQTVYFDGSGQTDPSGLATMFSDQRISFDTMNIKEILDLGFLSGRRIDSTLGEVELFYQQFEKGALIQSGANHLKAEVKQGLMIPTQVTANQGTEATVSMDVIPTFDGTNNPWVITNNVALPTRKLDSSLWTLGKATINGTDIEITSLSINLGIVPINPPGDGDQFNTFIAIDMVKPVITFDSLDISKLATFTQEGSSPGGTAVFYLRKLKQGGARETDATAVHIKFTVNQYQIFPTTTSAGKGATASTSYTVLPSFNGTNNQIVLSTLSAIS